MEGNILLKEHTPSDEQQNKITDSRNAYEYIMQLAN